MPKPKDRKLKAAPGEAPMEPAAAERREMLESTLRAMKRQGYQHFIEIQALEAQYPNGGPGETITLPTQDGRRVQTSLGKYLAEERAEMRRAYAAAKRMQELLDAIPPDEIPDAPERVDSDPAGAAVDEEAEE
jgi:hypothetical protein